VLEQSLKQHGLPVAAAHDERALSSPIISHTNTWLQDACPALALTITSATALLDLDAVIIDGSMHRDLIERVVAQTTGILDSYSWEGLTQPQLFAGTIGADARAMGGAILPLYSHFAPNRELFLKTENA
jgi:predicted NBD/HSP70 family sugar kinase